MAAGRERRHAAAAMQQLNVPGVRALGTEHEVLKYAELVAVGAAVGRRSVSEFALTVQHAEWLIRVWEGA